MHVQYTTEQRYGMPAPDLQHAEDMYPSVGISYGYIRVSTSDRNEDEQLDALRAVGVHDDCIFIDNAPTSLVATEYMALLQRLNPSDRLIIKSLDKLGSTYEEIIAQWHMLSNIKQVQVAVLDIPNLDTGVPACRINEAFLSEMVLQFLAYVSSRERESIRQRQHEGIIAAQQRGVRFGRPPKPIPPQFDTLLAQWKGKEISSRKAAQQLGVAQETFLRWSRKREQNLI